MKKITDEKTKDKENRNLRRRNKAFKAPEKTDEELAKYKKSILEDKVSDEKKSPKDKPLSGGLWTDDDLNELVRLTKKYPGGQTDRWEIIADAMNRNVSEVTFMAAKMKVPANVSNSNVFDKTTVLEDKKNSKTKTTDKTSALLVTETNWSQVQQQALEAAITKYPKSTAGDRWQQISNCVPNKSKVECILRYKYLVELIQKQTLKPDNDTFEILEDNVSCTEISNVVDTAEENQTATETILSGNKGKPKNKRKERKKNMDYYSIEDDDDNENIENMES